MCLACFCAACLEGYGGVVVFVSVNQVLVRLWTRELSLQDGDPDIGGHLSDRR